MYEGYNPGDSDLADDSEFDRVVERTMPSRRIPFRHNGVDLILTPANAALRMFFGPGLEEYSRVIVYPGDDSEACFKPDDDFMQSMVRGGFPVELPDKLDETDQEFMNTYMHIWTEDANDELGLGA